MNTSDIVKNIVIVAAIGGVAYGTVRLGCWLKRNVKQGMVVAELMTEFNEIETAYPDVDDALASLERDYETKCKEAGLNKEESYLDHLKEAYRAYLKATAETTPETPTEE